VSDYCLKPNEQYFSSTMAGRGVQHYVIKFVSDL